MQVGQNSVFMSLCSPNTCNGVFNPNVPILQSSSAEEMHFSIFPIRTVSHNFLFCVTKIYKKLLFKKLKFQAFLSNTTITKCPGVWYHVLLTLGAHAQQGLQYLVCHCLSVRLSAHAILTVRATKSITKDTIVLNVRFAAILKWCFS